MPHERARTITSLGYSYETCGSREDYALQEAFAALRGKTLRVGTAGAKARLCPPRPLRD